MRFYTTLSLGVALLTLKAPLVSADCCSCPNDSLCPDHSTACIPFATCCGQGPWYVSIDTGSRYTPPYLHASLTTHDLQQYFLLQL